jgi:hypothetical protein
LPADGQAAAHKDDAAAERKRLKKQRRKERDRQKRKAEQQHDQAEEGGQEEQQAAADDDDDDDDAPVLEAFGAGSDSDTESQDLIGANDNDDQTGPGIVVPRVKRPAGQRVQPLIRQDVRDRPPLETLYSNTSLVWARQHAAAQQGQSSPFFPRLTTNIADTVEVRRQDTS